MQSRMINENRLDDWVRGNSREAQGKITELVSRLVSASSPRPRMRRFPLTDSIGQPGPDGYLETDFGFNPYVPEGNSYWEIGTGYKARDKATSDYSELTKATPSGIRTDATFIFVTPLSATRGWGFTWKRGAQARWLGRRRQRKEWKDVRIIDGTGLIDWISHFPAVEWWLCEIFGFPIDKIQTAGQLWEILQAVGSPPPLTPHLFLANRDGASEKLKEVFAGTTQQLQLDTRFPEQVADFVAASVAALDEDSRADVESRCLIVKDAEAWTSIAALKDAHILIANFSLDDDESSGVKLIERARRGGHSIICGGMPGGVPHPNRIPISNPNNYQIKESLTKAGYSEERARVLSQKSGRSLTTLLRCLQNLSLMPEWAQDTHAADLAVAELLGSWTDQSTADRAIVERLSKKAYEEWIGRMRAVALRPSTPLVQIDGAWKMISRYEAWHSLGPILSDDQIAEFCSAAVEVLRERDPTFDLPPDERFAAGIRGKRLSHSRRLRNGLADSLAMLGSYPNALTSCSSGKAEIAASAAVREILAGADWILWASLNDLLPLLAEASPESFLDCVENGLNSPQKPFSAIFGQEGSDILFGGNYMTGLLWALETLAWSANYLTRCAIILAELAASDPGGNWGNRPSNSLATIFLPWLPQTCAPVNVRRAAIESMVSEYPKVAWKLMMSLLPQSHQVSSGSRKPAWREIIPESWSGKVTTREYWEQSLQYIELSIKVSNRDTGRLSELLKHLDSLPPPARDQLIDNMESSAIVSLSQEEKLPIWTELVDLISKHKKFSNAEWAMRPEVVARIETAAEKLAPTDPTYTHRRLFSERDFDLFEGHGGYVEQSLELEKRRQKAIHEIISEGGEESVIPFAEVVESPWRVGFSFGVIATSDADALIMPDTFESQKKSLVQLCGGFVSGRFRTRRWEWVDRLDTSHWTSTQKGQFLAFLPFASEAWERVTKLLGDEQAVYWTRTSGNPYEAEAGIEYAIDHLVSNGRPNVAIKCIEILLFKKLPIPTSLAIRALKAVVQSEENMKGVDPHAISEIVRSLQADRNVSPDELIELEWAFLPLLDSDFGAFPKTIEQRLAEDPSFICEVIRVVYRSKKDEKPTEVPTEGQKRIATNAYRLLSKWRTPPGHQKDGTYDGAQLPAWIDAVRTMCDRSGHLEVALTTIGHVLVHAPADADGLWLSSSVAQALNARDAQDMRDGFRTALFNSRGVFSWTGGREELSLAAQFRSKADAVEQRGFFRLATTIRQLADEYSNYAKQQAKMDPFEE
jgi:hypothetical protein